MFGSLSSLQNRSNRENHISVAVPSLWDVVPPEIWMKPARLWFGRDVIICFLTQAFGLSSM